MAFLALEKELGLKKDEKIIASWKGKKEYLTYQPIQQKIYDPNIGEWTENPLYTSIITGKRKEPWIRREKHSGVLVLTNRNLVFIEDEWQYAGMKNRNIYWIPLEGITAISLEGTWNPSITIPRAAPLDPDRFWLQGIGQKEFEPFRQLVMDYSNKRKEEKREGPEGEIRRFDEWLKANPNDFVSWFEKADYLKTLGRHEEELACYDDMLKIDPNHVPARYYKGTALHRLGRYEDALKCYDELLKIDPSNAPWLEKADALHTLGRYEEELACYDEDLKIDPKSDNTWNKKIDVLHMLGRHEEELACYDDMLKVELFELVDRWNDMGVALHKHGWYEKAIVFYDKAISMPILYATPESTIKSVIVNRTEALKALGKWRSPEEAVEWFDKAEDFRVDKKDFEQAIKCYEEALKIFSINAPLYSYPPVGLPVYTRAYPEAERWAFYMTMSKGMIEKLQDMLKNRQAQPLPPPPPPPPPPQAVQTCPTCSRPLTFVQQYNRWYCYNCKKYP